MLTDSAQIRSSKHADSLNQLTEYMHYDDTSHYSLCDILRLVVFTSNAIPDDLILLKRLSNYSIS